MTREEIDRRLAFVLNDVARLLRKQFYERARPVGMTPAQYRVLANLWRAEGINQSELAEVLDVENITLSRHVDKMEKEGWIERRRDPNDRRAWRLYISEAAHPLLQRMREIGDQTYRDTLVDLSATERTALLTALITLKERLLGMNGTGADTLAATGGRRHG